MTTVAVFLVDRAYGGPEEGGWWYDTGEPAHEYARFTRGFRNDAPAAAYAARLNRVLCDNLNKGRHPISSVLSKGRYRALVCDGNPRPYPETRPHYE